MDSEGVYLKFVEPFYLQLMHGLSPEITGSAQRRATLCREMARIAPETTDLYLRALWNTGYREALMASWWSGLSEHRDLQPGEYIQEL